MPYNTFATVSDGTTVQFAPGSLPVDGKAPRLYMYHDSTQAVGLVSERVDSPEAMYFTAKVSSTRAGDEALVLAADGVIDSVSVGVNPTEFKYDDEGNMTILAAEWIELSLVPTPAFAGATISQVAAEAPQVEEPKEEPKMEITPAVVEEVVVPTAPILLPQSVNHVCPAPMNLWPPCTRVELKPLTPTKFGTITAPITSRPLKRQLAMSTQATCLVLFRL